jgi:ABC-type multidrug transport system ATPase subunit
MIDLNITNKNCIEMFELQNVDINPYKLVLVTGDNASGKTVIRRTYGSRARKLGLQVGYIANDSRAGANDNPIAHLMIYGSEDEESTGAITCKSVTGIFKAVKEWDDNVVIIDEPELGLGEEAQLGMGLFLKQAIDELEDSTKKVIICTHSRQIISVLADVPHTFINVGWKYKTAHEWLNRKIVPIMPDEVEQFSDETQSKINRQTGK